jgi:hypothetical protein
VSAAADAAEAGKSAAAVEAVKAVTRPGSPPHQISEATRLARTLVIRVAARPR